MSNEVAVFRIDVLMDADAAVEKQQLLQEHIGTGAVLMLDGVAVINVDDIERTEVARVAPAGGNRTKNGRIKPVWSAHS